MTSVLLRRVVRICLAVLTLSRSTWYRSFAEAGMWSPLARANNFNKVIGRIQNRRLLFAPAIVCDADDRGQWQQQAISASHGTLCPPNSTATQSDRTSKGIYESESQRSRYKGNERRQSVQKGVVLGDCETKSLVIAVPEPERADTKHCAVIVFFACPEHSEIVVCC